MLMRKFWRISPYYNTKNINLDLELIYEGDTICKFKVSGKNRSIIIETDLPYKLATNSKKRVDWKLVEGVMYSGELFTAIVREIEYVIKNDGKVPRTPMDHPKNK